MSENDQQPTGEARQRKVNGGPEDLSPLDSQVIEQIGEKEARKLKARQEKHRSIWFGFGMFGMVGWSVAVPTLIGIAIGCWLDAKVGGQISWCLTFLFVGIVVGIAIAWNWLKKEGHLE